MREDFGCPHDLVSWGKKREVMQIGGSGGWQGNVQLMGRCRVVCRSSDLDLFFLKGSRIVNGSKAVVLEVYTRQRGRSLKIASSRHRNNAIAQGRWSRDFYKDVATTGK